MTDRALAWQQRAEKVLRTAEVSEELKKLNDTEANGRKEKKTKGKISRFFLPSPHPFNEIILKFLSECHKGQKSRKKNLCCLQFSPKQTKKILNFCPSLKKVVESRKIKAFYYDK